MGESQTPSSNETSSVSTDPPTPPSALKGFFVWSKEKVIGGVVVAIIASIWLGWWNSRSPSLQYSKGQSFSASPETGVISVTISNDGSTVAEDVECEVKFDPCVITSIEVKPTNLKASWKIASDGDKADISIPRLNSTEKLEVSIRATNPYQIDKTLKIAVRGRDIVGKERNAKERSLYPSIFDLSLLIGAVIVLTLLTGCFQVYGKIRMEQNEERRQSERLSRLPTLFKFLDGPLADKYVVGEQAKELRWQSNQITVGDAVYHI